MSDGKNEKTFLLHIVKRELLGAGMPYKKAHTKFFGRSGCIYSSNSEKM